MISHMMWLSVVHWFVMVGRSMMHWFVMWVCWGRVGGSMVWGVGGSVMWSMGGGVVGHRVVIRHGMGICRGLELNVKGKSKSWFAELVSRLIWFQIKAVLGDKKGNGIT